MNIRRNIASNVAAAAFALSAAQGAMAQTESPASASTQATPAVAATVQHSTYREWSPPEPLNKEIIGGLGLLYLGLCVIAWRRYGTNKGSAALRFMAGAVALYGLANHQEITQTRETQPTEALIVIDESPSQSFNNRAQQTTEHAAALEAALKAMPGVNVKTIRVAGERDGVAADGTRITASIDEALSNIPGNLLGGVFILSDGQVHDQIPEHLGKGVPVHVLISGKEGEYDRRAEIIEASPAGLIGKKQDIKFRITDTGPVPGGTQKVQVSVMQDGQVVATPSVTPGETATFSINIPHAGANIIEIKTDALKGEITPENNRAFATITGNHEKLNVLMISGSANPNTRMLRNQLKADPDVNLIHLNFSRLPDQVDDTPREEMNMLPFPMNEVFVTGMSKFNLLILDKPSNFYLLPSAYQINIANRVKEGGALMVLSGPELALPNNIFTGPLSSVLPAEPAGSVVERSFVPRISDRGQRHPVTRPLPGGNAPADVKSQPSWGPLYRSVDVRTPTGQSETVMEGADKRPLLILSHQEKGRVAMLNTDSLWRWERSYDAKGPYSQVLLNTAHWLMKKPDLEEEALNITQDGRSLVIEQQTMADKSTNVTLRTPSGKELSLTPEASKPGLWTIKVPIKEMGPYSVSQQGTYPRQAFINVGPDNPQEYTHTVSTTSVLKPLADRTQASTVRMADVGSTISTPVKAVAPDMRDKGYASADGMGVRMTEEGRLTQNDRKPVVPLWVLASAMFVLMAAAYLQQAGWKNALRLPFGRKQSNDNPAP